MDQSSEVPSHTSISNHQIASSSKINVLYHRNQGPSDNQIHRIYRLPLLKHNFIPLFHQITQHIHLRHQKVLERSSSGEEGICIPIALLSTLLILCQRYAKWQAHQFRYIFGFIWEIRCSFSFWVIFESNRISATSIFIESR